MTSGNELNNQQFPSWIAKFLEYTDGLPTPEIYRLWSAITTISGVLERKVYLRTSGRIMFPNLFVLLVGPPGVGKSVAIEEVRDLWASVGKLNIAPESMTGKGIVDQLKSEQGSRSSVDKDTGEWLHYHSILVPASEFGTLIRGQDLEQLSILNRLFDCGALFEERTRGGGLLRVERPHITLVAGTQPKYMGEVFPEQAFGMGFTSRIIMVYSGEAEQAPLFKELPGREDSKKQALAKELREIFDMSGDMVVEEDAQEAIESWFANGCEPAPQHTKLQHYNTRRIAHVLRLCMIMSAARTRDRIVNMEDFENARRVLIEAEEHMPEIFKEISTRSQRDEIEETFNFCWKSYHRGGRKPVAEHEIIHFLSQRVPTYQIRDILETMVRANILKEDKSVNTNLPSKHQRRRFIPNKLEAEI